MKRALLASIVLVLAACGESPTSGTTEPMAPSFGFDAYGYNYTARIFNGTCASWAAEKGLLNYCGTYADDKLVMKWNAEWDRGNQEGWANPPYTAWNDNEWNGAFPGGSGEVWHYKTRWYGPCTEGATLPSGGYCIWGQFEMLMDQGTYTGMPGSAHVWNALASPAGYGN